jgi:hypothetical protein
MLDDVFALQSKRKKMAQFGPQNVGANVVNQGPAHSIFHTVAGVGQQAGTAGHQIANTINYGPPDPWYNNLIARTQAAQGGSTTTPPQTNPGLDNLRNSINAQIRNLKNQTAYNKRQLLLGFGSQQMAQRSGLFTPAQLAAISDNPMAQTILGRLNLGYGEATQGFNELSGKANVFYGGARSTGLGSLGLGHISAVDAATKDVQSKLDQYDQDLTNAINQLWINYAQSALGQQ